MGATGANGDVIVIGAGPAGLATSAALSRAGIAHRVLERGDAVGHTWTHLYDSLVLHTARRLSALPGLPFPASVGKFPTRRDLTDYLARYADTFRVPVETRCDVTSVTRNGGWVVRTASGDERRPRALVVASGIVANPYEPAIAGRERFGGRVLHSVEYRQPGPFAGERVLVVGAGNSAGEIATELAGAGARVTLSVRSGATVVPLEVAGIPIQYFGFVLASLPPRAQRLAAMAMGKIAALRRGASGLPPAPPSPVCPRVPLIGLHLSDALRTGTIALTPAIAEFTADGMRFEDGSERPFDTVILATGYRAAIGMMGSLVRRDQCGFGRRHDRVVSDDQPDLYFVGHNYGLQGSLYNIGRDARIVASRLSAG